MRAHIEDFNPKINLEKNAAKGTVNLLIFYVI